MPKDGKWYWLCYDSHDDNRRWYVGRWGNEDQEYPVEVLDHDGTLNYWPEDRINSWKELP